jgi:hypothetical protein
VRRTLVALAAAAMLTGPLVATPDDVAAQVSLGDNLVNVQVGDITLLQDVNISVAADVTAQVCGIAVQNVTVLATEVDQTGTPRTVCQTPDGHPLRIIQN